MPPLQAFQETAEDNEWTQRATIAAKVLGAMRPRFGKAEFQVTNQSQGVKVVWVPSATMMAVGALMPPLKPNSVLMFAMTGLAASMRQTRAGMKEEAF